MRRPHHSGTREPPPYYDGEDPSRTFKPWLRELEFWAFDTEIPRAKHGTRILRRLGGVAKAAANELETSEIMGEKGKDNILAKLREYIAPHLETTMPKAFEAAVYGEGRGARESLGEYIARMDAAFRNLKDEGVDLPSEARGYVLFRQARLSTVQEDQLTTWTEGKFGRDVVIRAMRKLDKVREQGSSAKRASYFDEGEGYEAEPEEESDNDEEYIYMEQADLQEVYEEAEVKQALATYQQVRRALQDQKNAREYYPTEKRRARARGRARRATGQPGPASTSVCLSCARNAQNAVRWATGLLSARTRPMDTGSLGVQPPRRQAPRRVASAARPGFTRPPESAIRVLSGVKSRC